MQISSIKLHRIHMPLVRPFRTSFGTEVNRDVLLVEVITDDGFSGWAESSAMEWPGYSAEYVDGVVDVVADFLIPALWTLDDVTPESAHAALASTRGHPMAKSAVETAVLDAWLRQRDESLATYLGATRDRVDCGVSVGIPTDESIDSLLGEVDVYVTAGYRRIKLKIEPGWDLEPVRAVRQTWPSIPLQVDANQAYSRQDGPHLSKLDENDLILIEQPLAEDDLLGHAQLATQMVTPMCLDESILSVASAESAIEFKATSIINIKPARVGGYLEAKAIHDLCLDRSIPVWCGGMLETGIGRAANVALAALPGFTVIGDTSASNRYFSRDITTPFVLDDGQLPVPTGPGIGVEPLADAVEEFTVWSGEIQTPK